MNERKTTSHYFGAGCYILCKNVDDIWFKLRTMFTVSICFFKNAIFLTNIHDVRVYYLKMVV